MTVGAQKIRQARLKLRGQSAAVVVSCQLLRRRFAHYSRGVRVGAYLPGERPERQVHLGGGVVRESTQHHPPFVFGGEVPQELTGEGRCPHTSGKDRARTG